MTALVPPPGGVTRLAADQATERQIVLLRGALGVGLLVCSAWLFALPDMLPRAFAAAGVVFALLWLVRAAKLVQTGPTTADKDYLELGHDGLKLHEAGRDQLFPWTEIVRVAIDYDRLTLALLRHSGEIVHLEPRYRGVTLEDLCEAVRALHSSAQSEGAPPSARS